MLIKKSFLINLFSRHVAVFDFMQSQRIGRIIDSIIILFKYKVKRSFHLDLLNDTFFINPPDGIPLPLYFSEFHEFPYIIFTIYLPSGIYVIVYELSCFTKTFLIISPEMFSNKTTASVDVLFINLNSLKEILSYSPLP